MFPFEFQVKYCCLEFAQLVVRGFLLVVTKVEERVGVHGPIPFPFEIIPVAILCNDLTYHLCAVFPMFVGPGVRF